jgi:hypothetical protein
MERTKLGLSRDKMYKALGEGERTSKKVSSIRLSDGTSFKRRNANQHGTAEGGNDYTEKRSNRSDRFDLGGTADSSNTGANMGGTMGSSIMKTGGKIKGFRFSGRIKELTDKLSRENKDDVVRVVVNYYYDNNKEETLNNLKELGVIYSRKNDNETARNIAEIQSIFALHKSQMKTGGEIGDNFMVTLATLDIDMPRFQRYLKSKNIKFKKNYSEIKGFNSAEVDYFGTYNSLKSMIDKYWAMDSDKEEKKEYYDLIEKMKTNKKNNGGGTGVSSQTGFTQGTNAELLMNKDYLAYKKGGKVEDKKIVKIKNLEVLNEDFGKMTYNEALEKVKKLGGNWRLPSLEDFFNNSDGSGLNQNRRKLTSIAVNESGDIGKCWAMDKEVNKGKEARYLYIGKDGMSTAENKNKKHTLLIVRNTTAKDKMANGGLADVPESFPSNDAVSYKTGGAANGYKLTLKNWDADVFEDDYNEGEGEQVNSFSEKVNKSFASGEELLKYISKNVLYKDVKKEYYSIMDDDGRIVTSILVDENNSAASENEIEKWKKGDKKLYSASYNFYITLTQEKTPSADELSKLLGISVYKKGGRLSKYANGGSTKSFEYTIGGL